MKPYASGPGWELYRGDSLDVLRSLEPASVDAVITDPPYSSGGFTRTDRNADPATKYLTNDSRKAAELSTFGGDSRDARSFLLWCGLWLGLCLRASKSGAFVGLFTDWRQIALTIDAVQIGGFVYRGIAPWRKPMSRPQKGRPKNECEYLVWGSAGPMPMDGPCHPGWFEGSAPSGNKRVHITQKPDNVMREIVRICPPGGVVLDPFVGSGATGVAAILEGRRFIGIERSEAHLETAARRILEASGG